MFLNSITGHRPFRTQDRSRGLPLGHLSLDFPPQIRHQIPQFPDTTFTAALPVSSMRTTMPLTPILQSSIPLQKSPQHRQESHTHRRNKKHRNRKRATTKVVGYIMDDNTVQCSMPECSRTQFGRQADFRRHRLQVHSRDRPEYWCNQEGCRRSYAPGGGNRTSFGARKDKRDEHLRNVHGFDPRQHSPQGDSPTSQDNSPSSSF
ncbi:hypothetical protein BCR34DRAFT_100982 [Clohesyomyces aquaticus]|uniref:Uncharacterized protein n=1 Tax=Clohesyomyces aquaticus TaxID=1231657 RepID=A0A1Y1YSN5_9PLEO|nr:hypothetical protein BCR34DRAFT_100982 [Clohesyomyces aquaticus]